MLCKVDRVTTFAAWCSLVEYPEITGMIHISEVAGKWVRDIREHVKKGRRYVAKVIGIDYQKKHVNLSLKRVTPTEQRKILEGFRREQRAERVLEKAAKSLKKDLNQAYEEVGFALQEKFGSLADAFEQPLKTLDLPLKWLRAIDEVLKKVVKPRKLRIRAELRLSSLASDGIKRIQRLLLELKKRTGASISYISAPRYRVELETTTPKKAERKLRVELERLMGEAKKLGVEASFELLG